MIKNAYIFTTLCCLALALGACSNAKEELGLNRSPPDEFKVVKRAPLEIPPSFNLRPPEPGAPRPQELSPTEEAKQAVLGSSSNAVGYAEQTEGEALLLQQAGATNPDPNIRAIVNAETVELSERNKPVAQKLFGIGGSKDEISASVVDAKAEAQRIKENEEEGKPITEGETPAIEE